MQEFCIFILKFNSKNVAARSDTKSVYGGVESQNNFSPGNADKADNTYKENFAKEKANKDSKNAQFWLYQIQSTILM